VSLSKIVLIAVVGLATIAAAAATKPQLIVFCSPGSPGTAEEARPAMDTFAAAVSASAGSKIAAVYEPTEAGGVARIKQSGLAVVSLPFFLKHEKELGLQPRLEAVQAGRPARERWTLVAQKGRVKSGRALAGFTIVSAAAFAPGFVRGAVRSLGPLPADVKLVESGAVLSSLRRAAAGEPVAVLLDGPQEASLASLPFAGKLEVVAQSPPLPAGLVVTDSRVSRESWTSIEAALLGLSSGGGGSEALAAIHTARFAPLDGQALAAARKMYSGAP
jgi:hypothetical protein